jgi:hypothetical protein
MKSINPSLLIAFISTFLYCSSTVFTHGFLGVFGLDVDILSRDFNQVVYHGLVLNISNLFFIPFSLVVLSCLHLIFMTSNFSMPIFETIKKWLEIKTKERLPIDKKYTQRMNDCLLIFVAFLVFFAFMVYFEKKGVSEAKKIQKSIIDKKYSTVFYKDQDPIASLYCGSKNCAGLDIKTGVIKYFPHTFLSYKPFKKTKKADKS